MKFDICQWNRRFASRRNQCSLLCCC